jgi:hypothetical protein
MCLILLLLSRAFRWVFGGPAPLLCNTRQSHNEAITYAVGLAPGYSLEQHKQTCGRAGDLEQAIIGAVELDDPLFGNFILYDVKLNDSTLLDAIRSDFGVVMVECPGDGEFRGVAGSR